MSASKPKKKSLWGSFFRFYTHFRIPWWLFIISFVSGIVYTEIGVKVTEYTVLINTGKLYNGNILAYAGFTLLASVISILTNMTAAYGTGIITLRARGVIYKRILSLAPSVFEKKQPSEYVSRITADIPSAASVIRMLSALITSVYSFVRYYMVFYKFSPILTMWMLLAIPLAILTFWIVGRTQFFAEKKIYASINTMTAFFSEHLGAVKHFKAQTMEEQEREAGFKAIDERFKADIFNGLMVSLQTTINSIYTNICTIILIFTGRNLINNGQLASTGINEGSTYLSNVQKYLAELLTHYQTLKGAQGVLTEVAEIADTAPETVKHETAMPQNVSDIRIDNVKFSYTEEKEILHGISAVIPAGKKTAIVGNNGCGKSTLFRLLMRFYNPTEGAIYYGDTDISAIHLDEWRTSFGYVLQSSPLLSGTIRDNIVYGCDRQVSEDEIIAAAKAANCYDFIMEFPEGFNKEVGEGGTRLSGGQRQRIAIARAIITNPTILLMDEATASLDYQSDRLIWAAMERLMEGRTTVLIAHDMTAVMSADNIIVMNHGYIEATGTHDELMKTSPTYQEYVRLQTYIGGVA